MPKRNKSRVEDVSLPSHLWPSMRKHLEHVIRTFPKHHGFKGEYLQQEIFSKYLDPHVVTPQVRRSKAIEKWLKTEQKNLRVNRHLMLFEGNLGWTEYFPLRDRIRSIISRILGPIPSWSSLTADVTNGASTRVRRKPDAAIEKLTGVMHVTPSAVRHWEEYAQDNILAALPIKAVEGSVLFTVPKRSDIDRVACKEPECNMILQRMLGIHMARRLRRVGIDLTDQTNNQKAAAVALQHGLATIDLSSASDSVSRQLVMELLPAPWWSLLDDLRVTHTFIDGTKHELAMFSSMGNGFTFELETIIFYAITRAVCWLSGTKGKILVYGDDIIAPCRVVPRLMRVLSLFGFTVNPKKTHYRGPFRESCGKHYHSSRDVTPFYIRKAVTTIPELINLLNHLLEWDGRGWGFFMNEEPYKFWRKYREYVPRKLWGGIDPMDPSALVTGHRSRKRLVPVTRPVERDDLGAIRLWLLRRDTSSLPLDVDPSREIGFTTRTYVDLGERTSWVPDLIWDSHEGEGAG